MICCMSKKIKTILLISVSLVLGVFIYLYSQFYNYYERGSKDYFNIQVGERFTVKFYENSSAQNRECWMNEGDCSHVQKAGEDYQRRMFSSGCDGCGGFTSWTFVGHKIGIDTIKLNYCPPEYWCSSGGVPVMLEDSIVMMYDEKKQIRPESIDYEFIVEVTE